MKRFVTYLYEYERGQKSKNTGFVRVDIRGNQLRMETCIRNYLRGNELGEVFVLIRSDSLVGIKIGEIRILGNQSDARFALQTENIMESGYTFTDIVGIGIRLRNNGYLASCWNDEDAECIGKGMFSTYQKEEIKISGEEAEAIEGDSMMQVAEVEKINNIVETVLIEENTDTEELAEQAWINSCRFEEVTTYRKIELDQIHSLPSPNWHLCNNSFLVHGFFNYGYLILKKEMEEDKEVLWLGVPGFFEKPEMVMAVLFGFSEFEAVPQEVVELRIDKESIPYTIEKNQEPKTGFFGCWFVKLNE